MRGKIIFYSIVFFHFLFGTNVVFAKTTRFAEVLCEDPRFECLEIQEGQTWDSLWEEPNIRNEIKRLNRMNIKLRPGMKIAVPVDVNFFKDPKNLPFPSKIDASGEKQIRVDLSLLAWGAYDEEGQLQKWGPASGGKAWCPDVKSKCRTPSGDFFMLRKGGAFCKSHKFPIPKGGAPMPYCMFFRGGYALHGSPEVPGYNASHGCVRLSLEDAQWLNEEFSINKESEEAPRKIKIVIEPYSDIDKNHPSL